MHIIASLVGFAGGFVAWFIGSYGIARFINWGATRPQPMSEKTLKTYEIILCGLLFVLCFGILFVIADAMWPES